MKCRVCKAKLIGNEKKGDRCNKCIDAAIAETEKSHCPNNCDCHFTERLARSYAAEF